MASFYAIIAMVYFFLATLALTGLSLALLVMGFVDIYQAATTGGDITASILDTVGLLIVGFAIMETAKFVAEEEIIRKRELRSAHESRRSLTKFVTIVVIAASLEALVMVFRANHGDTSEALYPSLLLIAATFALVGLGLYQWFSSRIDRRGEVAEKRDE